MGDKSFAKDPLLFIEQPKTAVPKAPMQDHYFTPKKIKVKDNDIVNHSETAQQEIPKIRPRNNTFKSNLTESVYESEAESKPDKQRKQFKDMTTSERVEYFLDSPSFTPKLKCEIKVSGKSYRGIITDFKDEIVFMNIGRRVAQIPFNDINDIRLLGF